MKIHLIQISSNPSDSKEIKSHSDLSKLDVGYIRHINPNFIEMPPSNLAFGEKSDIKMTKKYQKQVIILSIASRCNSKMWKVFIRI